MKRIPTLSILESSLQEDLAWRRKELSSLYLAVQSAKAGSESQVRAIRCGIAMSYAHLEGFTREAARCYFAYVKSRNLTYADLAPSFMALKLSRMVNQATLKASYYGEAVALLTLGINNMAELPEPEIISAESNLNFAQLTEMLYCINIDIGPFALKENFMDEVLLKRRNAIVHGEFRKPELSDYLEIHNEVVEMLDLIRNSLVIAAGSERFRRSVPS